MTTALRLILLIPVLSWCAVVVLCQATHYYSVDEVCLDHMPSGVRKPRTRLGLLPFIIMCSNLNAYIKCLLEYYRSPYQGNQHFELYFPTPDDHFRGGYLFCIEELPQALAKYTFNEDDILRCEVSLNYSLCDIKDFDIDEWDDFVTDSNQTALAIISCNHTWIHYNCLRDQYMKCNSSYAILFTYYFARLGPDCLLFMQESNDLILSENCAVTVPSVSEGPSTLHARIGPVLAVGLAGCLLGFLFPERDLVAM